MNTLLIMMAPQNASIMNSQGYTLGLIIAILLLGYLIYTLINPEKF
jgi:K+-transporting ATPase KdpF subunit